MYDPAKVASYAAELAASSYIERPAVLARVRADVLTIKLAGAPLSHVLVLAPELACEVA